jgi:hypothetical protein
MAAAIGFIASPPALAQADLTAFCNAYADDAVAANDEQKKNNCGFGIYRWSSDRNMHFQACMGWKDRAAALALPETNTRVQDLATCWAKIIATQNNLKNDFGNPPLAPFTGTPLPASIKSYCTNYGKIADLQQRYRVDAGCGARENAGRWDSSPQRHVDGCMTWGADTGKHASGEMRAREWDLLTCKAAAKVKGTALAPAPIIVKQSEDRCPAGEVMVGVRYRSGAWMDQIAVACAATGRAGGPHFLPARGGDGGGPGPDTLCPDPINLSVVGIEASLTLGDQQVRRIKLLCGRRSGPDRYALELGGPANSPNNGKQVVMNCNPGESAVGLSVGYGQYVTSIKLLCGWVTPSTNTPSTSATPGTTSPLGAQIVKFATDRLDKCVDGKEVTRNEHCPPLPAGQTGDGECTHLAMAALDSVGARIDPGKYDWGKKVSESPYKSSADIQPGDIIQLFNTEFDDPRGKDFGWSATSSQHTAIVESNNGGVLGLLEQNTWTDCTNDGCKTNRRFVTRGTLNLNWTLVRGNFIIYRAEKKAGFAREVRALPTSGSGYRRIVGPSR